jgi:hypothetical protein
MEGRISRVAARILASPEGHFFMELGIGSQVTELTIELIKKQTIAY